MYRSDDRLGPGSQRISTHDVLEGLVELPSDDEQMLEVAALLEQVEEERRALFRDGDVLEVELVRANRAHLFLVLFRQRKVDGQEQFLEKNKEINKDSC